MAGETESVFASMMDSSGVAIDLTAPVKVQGPTAVYRLLSAAATTNLALIRAAPTRVFNLIGWNAVATAHYIKLYNKASAAPVLASDVPVATIYVPASGAFTHSFPNGLYFATGLGIAITNASGDTDTTALSAGDILALNVAYD